MNVNELLTEAYARLPDLVGAAVDGLTPPQLRWVPQLGANSIGWLVWHLTRIQDHHVAQLLGTGQLWTEGDRAGRFGRAADPDDTGYGHTPEQVAAVAPQSPQVLVDYHAAVWDRTRSFLAGLAPADLDRVVDDSWDPPVTLGVRLVSVVDDSLQHAGQAGYVRGLLPG
ncbi:mycothiol transferase [Micromonospora sp. SH-82]|uniref:mycothiol transferase n=1 Tax=Micromonospora sp. SH-82 TaxID=3132938 RepID=UPI003EBBAB02